MKRIFLCLGFIVVFVAGAVVGGVVVSSQSDRMMARFAAASLTEIATDVRQIEAGQSQLTAKRKADAVPGLVRDFHTVYRPHLTDAEYNSALWNVERYYEQTGKNPPATIKPIISALPPRPKTSCELEDGRPGGDK